MASNQKQTRGGRRPGAGRKPSTLKGVVRRLPGDTAALILTEIKAQQKWVELANSRDQRIVLETLKYLSDRAYGRPRQGFEIADSPLRDAFDQMSDEELLLYASQGTLPPWFPKQ